ncbi:MAG: hypothetical protein WBA23_18545 [Tunicatimonas sp.]|uniref:LVIVD repeat-containing protein n=1 Tax=Tunicatimonas sp. TaxID=1940096 RepID=UPI003C73AE5F
MNRIIYFLFLGLSCLFFSCEDSSDVAADFGDGTGQGGSLARFAIRGDHLYTVDRNDLHVYDVSDVNQPRKVNQVSVGAQIETIFPRLDNLFIGSQGGMFIYSITQPTQPQFLSNYIHVVSCDPVVADERYAYVTLRSIQNVCGRFTDQLDIVDISDLRSPFLQRTYPMTHPKGLGVDGNELFVCDDGLKVFDISNVDSLVQKYHFRIEANDVIPYRDYLMVIGSDGLYQYRYSEDTIVLASQLPFIPVL